MMLIKVLSNRMMKSNHNKIKIYKHDQDRYTQKIVSILTQFIQCYHDIIISTCSSYIHIDIFLHYPNDMYRLNHIYRKKRYVPNSLEFIFDDRGNATILICIWWFRRTYDHKLYYVRVLLSAIWTIYDHIYWSNIV